MRVRVRAPHDGSLAGERQRGGGGGGGQWAKSVARVAIWAPLLCECPLWALVMCSDSYFFDLEQNFYDFYTV